MDMPRLWGAARQRCQCSPEHSHGRTLPSRRRNPPALAVGRMSINSKWTAVTPLNREKHFLITELDFDEDEEVIHCLIEAIISKRSEPIEWQELKNDEKWLQGWK
ncbi:TIGR02450 family Trp-rich protein [Thiothrix litoralis]